MFSLVGFLPSLRIINRKKWSLGFVETILDSKGNLKPRDIHGLLGFFLKNLISSYFSCRFGSVRECFYRPSNFTMVTPSQNVTSVTTTWITSKVCPRWITLKSLACIQMLILRKRSLCFGENCLKIFENMSKHICYGFKIL